MVTIKWEPSAWQLFNDYIENAKIEFGKKTGLRWVNDALHIYERLQLFPESYPPEELLLGRTPLYRRFHIMGKRFTLIYYYDEAENIVHIVDVWDTKMNPKTLIRRIK